MPFFESFYISLCITSSNSESATKQTNNKKRQVKRASAKAKALAASDDASIASGPEGVSSTTSPRELAPETLPLPSPAPPLGAAGAPAPPPGAAGAESKEREEEDTLSSLHSGSADSILSLNERNLIDKVHALIEKCSPEHNLHLLQLPDTQRYTN